MARRRGMMAGFFDDVATIITHPADDVNAVVSVKLDDIMDAMQAAPIVGGLAPDVKSFLDGPMRDFAKSPVGAMVLTCVTMGAASALPILGPQLSFLAFATPGMIEGGTFGPAWVNGYIQYLRQGAKVLSQGSLDISLPDVDIPPEVAQTLSDYAQSIQDGVKTALDYLHGLTGVDLANMTYDELAAALHIRYDSAVWALANARGNMAELQAVAAMNFDPETGNPITAAQAHEIATAHPTFMGKSMQLAQLYTAPAEKPKNAVVGTSYLAGRYVSPAPTPAAGTADAAVAANVVATLPPKAAASTSSTLVIAGGAALVGLAGLAWFFKWPPAIFRKGK